jgi:hypothetical protein
MEDLRTYSKERLITEMFSVEQEFKALKTQILQELDLLDLLETHYNNLDILIKEKELENGTTEER